MSDTKSGAEVGVTTNGSFEKYLKQVLQNSLVKPPEEMMEDCLSICIELATATGGSILAEEGPALQFLFSNEPSLIGMNVPWDSIAGNTARQSTVIYTYAPSDKRHFDGIDGALKHRTRYLLSIPIPSIHTAAEERDKLKSAGVLQLLFNENIFPEHDPTSGPVEFSLQAVREQAPYEDQLKHVFWILPNISFGMEVMRLRQTSYQVIHELKNKLIAAQSWLNCLREDLTDMQPDLVENEDIREDMDLAEGAAREGSKLAVGYLQLTKIYAPECVEMDINEVLRHTAADVRAFAADHAGSPIDVAMDLGEQLPKAHADPDQLRMAFFNLCKNAVEALAEVNAPNARVTLSSSSTGARVSVTVADNGPGMPEEIAANLFKAFKTKKEGGTGLGLTITKKIVDIHGGNIRCDTSSNGTRFLIEL